MKILTDLVGKLYILKLNNCKIIIDGCPSETTSIPPNRNDPFPALLITWPETNIGDTARVGCPCGNIQLMSTSLVATRRCGGSFENGARWEIANDAPCNFSDTTREICQLSNVRNCS